MKNGFALALAAAAILLFGCIGGPAPTATPTLAPTAQPTVAPSLAPTVEPTETPTATQAQVCEQSEIRVSEIRIPSGMVLGRTQNIPVSVTYKENCDRIDRYTIELWDPLGKVGEEDGKTEDATYDFDWGGRTDGDVKITVKIVAAGKIVDERDAVAKVELLGFWDETLADPTAVTVSPALLAAQRFEISEPVTVRSVIVPIRRYDDIKMGNLVPNIRPDNGEKPSPEVLGQGKFPLMDVPLKYGWTRIALEKPVELKEGVYWLVLNTDSGTCGWKGVSGNPWGIVDDTKTMEKKTGNEEKYRWQGEGMDMLFKLSGSAE